LWTHRRAKCAYERAAGSVHRCVARRPALASLHPSPLASPRDSHYLLSSDVRSASRGATLTRRRALPLLLAGGATVSGLVACQPARLVRRDTSRRLVLRINQYGSAAYAPLLLMRERRLLEEALPGLSVEWKIIPSALAVNQALVEGGLEIAAGPSTAFLLAREAGVPVRIAGAVSALPCAVVGRAGLRSLRALRPEDRVAVPDEVSLEAAVLHLAALRELGDARALDANMVTRPGSEVVAAGNAGKELAAHVAVSPFLEVALEGTSSERLVDSRELFGGLPTAALVYALPALREQALPLLETFTQVLAEASLLAAADPPGTARLLSEPEELRISPERLGDILAQSGWQLGGAVVGVTRITDLWRHTGRLKRTPAAWSELAFAGVQGN
jgi:NitT/TauT family transport system substrate-binding protein